MIENILKVEVDIDHLTSVGDTITIQDLPTTDAVTIMADADELVAHIEAHTTEDETEAEEADLSALEVTPPRVGSDDFAQD